MKTIDVGYNLTGDKLNEFAVLVDLSDPSLDSKPHFSQSIKMNGEGRIDMTESKSEQSATGERQESSRGDSSPQTDSNSSPMPIQTEKASHVSGARRRRSYIVAIVISACLALLLAFFASLAAGELEALLQTDLPPWIAFAILGVTFIISLPVTIYLALRTFPESGLSTGTNPISTHRLIKEDFAKRWNNQLPDKLFRELVGRDILIGEIMSALRDPSGKWIIAIDGMGGIGKTALARELVDRCLAERLFDAVIWEQSLKAEIGSGNRRQATNPMTFETVLDAIARQLGMPDVSRLKVVEKETQVKSLLKSQRVLVVLDNLETSNEAQNDIARKLLPHLDPSKALLTSRHRFSGDFYSIHLSGLNENGALRFIRQEAEEKGIRRVMEAKDNELKIIGQATGGSPLALKLVVGQLSHLSLDTVLSQLRNVRTPASDNDEDEYLRFYKGIFFPSWRLLSEESKKLLISMSHFAPGIGGTLEAIKTSSDLSDDILPRSIDELWRFSFVEVGKSTGLKKVRYYLHTLTQYFILSDIVQIL